MRPVNRGAAPASVVFRKYSDARNHLVKRMGDYCSYCEMPCNEGPDVEHVTPKSLRPDLELSWDNFLLACGHCNRAKSDKVVELSRFAWPDRHNTFLFFRYPEFSPPCPAEALTDAERARAARTIALVALDRLPKKSDGPHGPRDTRWQKRYQAWNTAKDSLADYLTAPARAMVEQIVRTAIHTGFWSVWMTVFREHKDVIAALIDRFPGTAGVGECFEEDFRPCPRRATAHWLIGS